MTTPLNQDPAVRQKLFAEELGYLSQKDSIWNGYLVVKNNSLARIGPVEYLCKKIFGTLQPAPILEKAFINYLINNKDNIKSISDVYNMSDIASNVGKKSGTDETKFIDETIKCVWQSYLNNNYPHLNDNSPPKNKLKPKDVGSIVEAAPSETLPQENLKSLIETIKGVLDEGFIPDIKDGFVYTRTENPVKYATKIVSGDTIFFIQDPEASNSEGTKGLDIHLNLNQMRGSKNGKEAALTNTDLELIKEILSAPAQRMIVQNYEIFEFFREITSVYKKESTDLDQIFVVKDKMAHATSTKDGWAEKGIEIRFNPATREVQKNGETIRSLEAPDAALVADYLAHVKERLDQQTS